MKRPHDEKLARQESLANQTRASSLRQWPTPGWHAEYTLLQLQDTLRLGLMSCYESFGCPGHFADFWADLPWDRPTRRAALRLILADPRFAELQKGIMLEHSFDLRRELQAGLAAAS